MNDVERRFWARVDKNGPIPTGHMEYDGLGPCWLFQARSPSVNATSKDPGGLWGAKRMLAHRYSYRIHHGVIPKGQVVRHKCDNTRCVNPEHLEPGTQQDNVNDLYRRGRRVCSTGLTPQAVHMMRDLVDEGCSPILLCRLVALILGISESEAKSRLYKSPEGVIGRPPPKHRKPSNFTTDELRSIQAALLAQHGRPSLRAALRQVQSSRDKASVKLALKRDLGWDLDAWVVAREAERHATEQQAVVDLWEEGLSVHQIHQQTALTHHRIKHLLSEAGMAVERRYRKRRVKHLG